MNKQEAILLLCQMFLIQFTEKEKEALSMAIESLQKEIERENDNAKKL